MKALEKLKLAASNSIITIKYFIRYFLNKRPTVSTSTTPKNPAITRNIIYLFLLVSSSGTLASQCHYLVGGTHIPHDSSWFKTSPGFFNYETSCGTDPLGRTLYCVWSCDMCPGQIKTSTGCGNPPPNPNRGPNDDCSANSAKPVNIATGSKFFQVTDFQDNDYPLLTLKRTYDSSDGRWTFNYASQLYELEGKKYVTDSNGASHEFYQNGTEWNSELGGAATLKEVNGAWVYTTKSEIKNFDSQGRLISKKNTSGQEITFSYQNDLPIIDISYPGGSLSIHYSGNPGWIRLVELPSGDQIEYHYDTTNPKRILKVTNIGYTTEYRYEHETLPEAITSIVSADGQTYKTIEYYDDGRVKTSSLATNTASDSFSYPSENVTTVTNPLGKQTTYHFADYFGSKKITQVEGHASNNCMAANKDYEYYPDGLLKSKTDWKGVKTTFEYNDRGLRIKRTDAEGTTEQRQTGTEWHTNFPQPVKITEPDRETHFEYDTDGKLIKRTVKPLQP